jgi:hypothetical protein
LRKFVAKPDRANDVCDALLHLVEPSREPVRTLLNEQAVPDLVAPPTLNYARPLSSPDPRPARPRASANSPAQVTLVPFFSIRAGEVDPVGQPTS